MGSSPPFRRSIAGDMPEVKKGFAKRGIGTGAVSPPSNSTSLAGVVESFNSMISIRGRCDEDYSFRSWKHPRRRRSMGHGSLGRVRAKRWKQFKRCVTPRATRRFWHWFPISASCPATPEQVGSQKSTSKYSEGLASQSFFEPLTQRVTLSTEVGAEKPSPKIFQAAIDKIGAGLGFQDACLSPRKSLTCIARGDWGLKPFTSRGRAKPGGILPGFSIWSRSHEIFAGRFSGG